MNHHAATGHPASDAALLAQLVGFEASRHPRIRAGERDPIPWTTRLAVLLRDARTCKRCGRYCPPGADADEAPNVDHITPWSAGGSDHTSNLRTLCAACNRERSNFRDIAETRSILACTWWCLDCWAEADAVHARWHARCENSRCWLESTGNDELYLAWACRPHLDVEATPIVLAYCAHCDATAYTTVTL